MEWLRRFMRRLVGVNSSIYGACAETLDFLATIRRESVLAWFALRAHNNAQQSQGASQPIKLRSLNHPIFIRPGTLDAGTIINNVIREEYGQFRPDGDPQWMIDAGAYIGDTAAYFLSRFPSLKVIALEPNPENHAMAMRNLKPYGDRAVVLKKGLYVDDGEYCFSGNSTAGSISKDGDKIECVSLPSLIRQFDIPRLDILKIDIEGAEEALFLKNPEAWLDRVNWLIIEIHTESILNVIARILKEHGFSMTPYRSVWYCRKR